MASHGYKKYMKNGKGQGHPLVKIFVISFFGMLLISTLIINSLAKNMTVDTSIGDYKEQIPDGIEDKKIVDNRLALIQSEDQNRSFTELMENPKDTKKNSDTEEYIVPESYAEQDTATTPAVSQSTVYKVYIGTYTSSEQAKVAKDIIQESGNGLTPIVKCLGANMYTLQVGIFKNKQGAESMLATIQNSNLPGRIVAEN